jgi:hypothetical protein
VKTNINSVEVHPQLSNNGHPVDGALVGAGEDDNSLYISTQNVSQLSFLTIKKSC